MHRVINASRETGRPRSRLCVRFWLAVAATGTLTLTACDAGPEAPTADAPPTAGSAPNAFHRGNGTEPDTLDPHRSEETAAAAAILRDLYEGLVTEAADSSLVPGAAERWEVSDGGLTYTFHLRDDGRWSNGDAVVAADFVAGLRRTVDPATASSYAQILYPIENAEAVVTGEAPPEALGVEALDKRTLEIRLETPTPYLLGLLTHSSTYPVHRPSLAEHGDRFARPGRLVSNGPYRLTEWVVQSHVNAERNRHYWDAADVAIDEVYYYPIENRESELSRYRAGELDYTIRIPDSRFD